jgi:hypothetical protein
VRRGPRGARSRRGRRSAWSIRIIVGTPPKAAT